MGAQRLVQRIINRWTYCFQKENQSLKEQKLKDAEQVLNKGTIMPSSPHTTELRNGREKVIYKLARKQTIKLLFYTVTSSRTK